VEFEMRVAYIADIHGNIYALESVAKDMKEEGVDEVVCLGDIVNFGAFPKECIDWVRDNCSIVLKGEHDAVVAMSDDVIIPNPHAIRLADWTYSQLTEEDLNYLAGLPFDYEDDTQVLTHDEPSIPGSMQYITSLRDAKDTMSCYNQQFCFYGHIHIPLLFKKDNETIQLIKNPDRYEIKEEEKYLINPGSVGQPRDKDLRASYLIFDTEKGEFIFKRVSYDYDKNLKALKENNFPEFLIKMFSQF
jgi:predicted phosphodiesterase